MKSSDVPSKFPIPFANSAGSLYTRTIPQASQIGIQDGAASLTDGFPPKCFVPVASGGTPPFGQDFNGLLKQVTQWDQWQQAGAPIVYDSAFQSSIGGYPMGAIIEIVAGGPAFMSTVENNTVAPAVGAAGWMPIPTFGSNVTSVTSTQTLSIYNAGLVLVNATAGNITITMPAVAAANGVPLPFNFVRVDSSANSVTINAAGSDKFQPSNSTSLSIGGGGAVPLNGDGSSAWRQIGPFVGGILIKETTFQANNTWTPDPRSTKIRVRMVGAGGGGGSGGGCGSGQTAVGGGGGAGAYHEFIIANPGAQTIAIGSGGIAGGNGGATSFGSISSCPGGGGAVFVNATAFTGAYNQGISGAGAAAPSSIVGTVITAGGASGDPGLALRVDSAVGGAGGDSVYGGGGRYSNQSAGFNASAPGAGGSGASVGQNTSSLTGGVGANGILILEEFM
jgi:hypothetical protein